MKVTFNYVSARNFEITFYHNYTSIQFPNFLSSVYGFSFECFFALHTLNYTGNTGLNKYLYKQRVCCATSTIGFAKVGLQQDSQTNEKKYGYREDGKYIKKYIII